MNTWLPLVFGPAFAMQGFPPFVWPSLAWPSSVRSLPTPPGWGTSVWYWSPNTCSYQVTLASTSSHAAAKIQREALGADKCGGSEEDGIDAHAISRRRLAQSEMAAEYAILGDAGPGDDRGLDLSPRRPRPRAAGAWRGRNPPNRP